MPFDGGTALAARPFDLELEVMLCGTECIPISLAKNEALFSFLIHRHYGDSATIAEQEIACVIRKYPNGFRALAQNAERVSELTDALALVGVAPKVNPNLLRRKLVVKNTSFPNIRGRATQHLSEVIG